MGCKNGKNISSSNMKTCIPRVFRFSIFGDDARIALSLPPYSRIHMYKTLKTSTARHSLRVYKKNQSPKAKRFLRVTKTNKQNKQKLSTTTRNQKPKSKQIKRRPGLDLGNASQKRHRREAGVGGHCTSANCENRPQEPDARPKRHHGWR